MIFTHLPSKTPRSDDYIPWFASPSSSSKQARKNKKRQRQNRRNGRASRR